MSSLDSNKTAILTEGEALIPLCCHVKTCGTDNNLVLFPLFSSSILPWVFASPYAWFSWGGGTGFSLTLFQSW